MSASDPANSTMQVTDYKCLGLNAEMRRPAHAADPVSVHFHVWFSDSFCVENLLLLSLYHHRPYQTDSFQHALDVVWIMRLQLSNCRCSGDGITRQLVVP